MDNKIILAAGVMAALLLGYFGATDTAFAQYVGNVGDPGETGQNTLEENLKLAEARLEAVKAHNANRNICDICTSMLYQFFEPVVGFYIFYGAVFGGIAGAFFVKARSGRYAEMGRG